MREEEKLPHDVYFKMYAAWKATIFETICASEQNHMEALYLHLSKYEVPDPIEELGVGDFSEESVFRGIYDSLIEDGKSSLVEALKVGAYIEELDIADLEAAIEETDNADLERVYGNLLRGSKIICGLLSGSLRV